MNTTTRLDFATFGIESIKISEFTPVTQVDVMTRSRLHALMLQNTFQVRPFRFSRGGSTLHAFPRLPAASAREWMETQGIAFALRPEGIREDAAVTWVQSGFAAKGPLV